MEIVLRRYKIQLIPLALLILSLAIPLQSHSRDVVEESTLCKELGKDVSAARRKQCKEPKGVTRDGACAGLSLKYAELKGEWSRKCDKRRNICGRKEKEYSALRGDLATGCREAGMGYGLDACEERIKECRSFFERYQSFNDVCKEGSPPADFHKCASGLNMPQDIANAADAANKEADRIGKQAQNSHNSFMDAIKEMRQEQKEFNDKQAEIEKKAIDDLEKMQEKIEGNQKEGLGDQEQTDSFAIETLKAEVEATNNLLNQRFESVTRISQLNAQCRAVGEENFRQQVLLPIQNSIEAQMYGAGNTNNVLAQRRALDRRRRRFIESACADPSHVAQVEAAHLGLHNALQATQKVINNIRQSRLSRIQHMLARQQFRSTQNQRIAATAQKKIQQSEQELERRRQDYEKNKHLPLFGPMMQMAGGIAGGGGGLSGGTGNEQQRAQEAQQRANTLNRCASNLGVARSPSSGSSKRASNPLGLLNLKKQVDQAKADVDKCDAGGSHRDER